jgi:hypothetical protein
MSCLANKAKTLKHLQSYPRMFKHEDQTISKWWWITLQLINRERDQRKHLPTPCFKVNIHENDNFMTKPCNKVVLQSMSMFGFLAINTSWKMHLNLLSRIMGTSPSNLDLNASKFKFCVWINNSTYIHNLVDFTSNFIHVNYTITTEN